MKHRALVLAGLFAASPVPGHAAPAPAAPVAATPDAPRAKHSAPGGSRNSYANPSAVIAAEMAAAQDAQVRGQWTALAATAAPDAVLFTPRMVWAQQWLKGRPNPPVATKWQTHKVWSSCDGSLMVTHGAYHKAGPVPEQGYYTVIWQRQPDGGYKWVLDHADSMDAAPAAPDMIAAHVAECPDRPARAAGTPPEGQPDGAKPKKPKPVKLADLPPLDPEHRAGAAADGSLKWSVTVDADGGRTLKVVWLSDGEERDALVDEVAAYVPNE